MYAIMEQVGYACITIVMVTFTVGTVVFVWHAIRRDYEEE